MKKTGAELIRYALEQIKVTHTFGIPGVHTTEIYDQLNSSNQIIPVLVTHECGAAFMADAVSRTSNTIGTLLIVPAAGITHAASGIGEAGLDGIPLLIISGGIHSESGRKYQLHDIDQHSLLAPIIKASFKVTYHHDVIDTVYKGYTIAISGEPGPVYIEMPYNISNFQGEVLSLPQYNPTYTPPKINQDAISKAIELIQNHKRIGLFVGWGCVDCGDELVRLAEMLAAPVSTTLQGLSVFPATHPLHTGMGFGEYAVPAAYHAFKDLDCLIAIGTRFSEIPTGSYAISPPENLIHIDINSQVFNANYPAKVTIEGDAKRVVSEMIKRLKYPLNNARKDQLVQRIAEEKQKYHKEWLSEPNRGKVNPIIFFNALRDQLNDDDFIVADDGHHTFLTAELMPIHAPRRFISPSDFNAMGYCVPASIGVKLKNPEAKVIGIVGDGGFIMTGMELLTATNLGLGVVIFVFNDGELSQIAQAQKIPYNRKTCTQIHHFKPEGIALASGAQFLCMNENSEVEEVIERALDLSLQNIPVVVDVKMDYQKATRFTKGVVKANLARFSTREKVRAVSRAVFRKVTG